MQENKVQFQNFVPKRSYWPLLLDFPLRHS